MRLISLVIAAAILSASCQSVLHRKYEYEEDIYLALDGSAIVYVNASVPALVALRGLPLDVDRRARLDRIAVREMFESPVAHVASVTTSRRDNRRYVHLRLQVPDVRKLGDAPAFAWSRYALAEKDGVLQYRQTIGPAAARDVGDVGWTGSELVGFRLHLPSQVPFHNAPSREIERGNIVRWEQPLVDRIKGQPIDIELHLETESILVRTLTLFGLMVLLAALTFGFVIWFVRRRAPIEPAS